MKQAANFRLDETVVTVINVLAKDLHTTKTDVIEKAVMQFASSLQKKRNGLIQFAGSLDANDAEAMLSSIQKDKDSKDIDVVL